MATEVSQARKLPLRVWLSVFCPTYRGTLASLAGLNLISAVGVFVELQLLRLLTVALSGPAAPPSATCSIRQWAASGFALSLQPCGASLPMFLLLIYAASILLQSAVDMFALTVNSRLMQRARRDAERELLGNLLAQDDAFFVRRSPAEIVSRLGGDLHRVSERRQNFTQGFATVLSIVATLLVIVSQSWIAALIGLAVSLVGVASAEPRMRKLRQLDREATLSDERVKATFEDMLQGAAEIQVSGVVGRMLSRFGVLQTVRDAIALRNAGLNNRNQVAQKLTFTLGFIIILAIFVFGNLFARAGGAAAGAATAGLIVVLISSLPELYFKFAEMTQRITLFRIAGESVRRLAQYEAPQAIAEPASPQAPASRSDGAVTISQVRYQFSGSQVVQGGPSGLNAVIPALGMTGVVGPAGSGKSTLIKLMLGRQSRLSGTIAFPAEDGRRLFAYLPQRPVLFDAPIRDNLFLGETPDDSLARVAGDDSLVRLGLVDLIRLKGLDAPPRGKLDDAQDFAKLRVELRAAAEAALGAPLRPLGEGAGAPGQMAIESQLGSAIDHEAFTRFLAGDEARKIVTALSTLDYGCAMEPLALAAMRATAPLLAKANDADEYNAIATCTVTSATFTLRRMALEMVVGGGSRPGGTSPLLVAIAISLKLEELAGANLPAVDGELRQRLAALAEKFSQPLDERRLNPLLPWRENLLFAALKERNSRDLAAIDHVLLKGLRTTPLDADVIDSGFDYAVGRQGGRLSGGQQQMIGLGRALLSGARFLVLDEPSSAFHPQLRQIATDVLKRESASRGVIVITHDFDLARACDSLIFIRDGGIVGQGAWNDLVQRAEGFAAWVAERGTSA